MKVLFATDLHGYRERFERVFELAVLEGAKAVLFGGDNFGYFHETPPEEAIEVQRTFFREFLPGHFDRYDRAGIFWLGTLSVHDIDTFDPEFESVCNRHTHVRSIQGNRFDLEGWEFIGWGNVVDHPFFCKIRCRRDRADSPPVRQFQKPMRPGEDGWEPISDWESHLAALPTLEQELDALPKPRNPGKAVYVLHHPPAKTGLDVVLMGAAGHPEADPATLPRVEIGSEAVRNFLERTQPLLALHGHVHESPIASGVWKTSIGRTICIQPGQHESGGKTHSVLIDLETLEIRRFLE